MVNLILHLSLHWRCCISRYNSCMWVLPYMKHMWSEFSALGLYQAEQRERDIKNNASIYGQNADMLESANYKKKRVNDETKNNGQWLERRKNGRLRTAEKHAKRKKWENLVEWQPGLTFKGRKKKKKTFKGRIVPWDIPYCRRSLINAGDVVLCYSYT